MSQVVAIPLGASIRDVDKEVSIGIDKAINSHVSTLLVQTARFGYAHRIG